MFHRKLVDKTKTQILCSVIATSRKTSRISWPYRRSVKSRRLFFKIS